MENSFSLTNNAEPDKEHVFRFQCGTCGCGSDDYMEEYYSLGIYAGRYCSDKCWQKSGYRDEGKEGYSFGDAGEHYDENEY